MNIVDSLVLLLVGGATRERVLDYCRGLGCGEEEAGAAFEDARRRIAVAADYVRSEQIGKAVMRLEGLYARAVRGKDVRVALQIQRELNRLFGLHAGLDGEGNAISEDALDALEEIKLVRAYLEPLGLVDGSYPVSEHARVAAELLRNHGILSNLRETQGAGTPPEPA